MIETPYIQARTPIEPARLALTGAGYSALPSMVQPEIIDEHDAGRMPTMGDLGCLDAPDNIPKGSVYSHPTARLTTVGR